MNLPKGEVLVNLCVSTLMDWGRVTHICVGHLTVIGSDNSLSPGRGHAIIWTDAGILLIGPSETDIKNHTFSFKKIIWKCPLIARFMGPTWGPSGPTVPRWAPVRPRELCYLGRQEDGGILYWPPCVNILRPSDTCIHRWFMSSLI